MRKKIIAGNWKMNLPLQKAMNLVFDLNQQTHEIKPNTQLILFPTLPLLNPLKEILSPNLFLGAQNISQFVRGAYTGEVSGEILDSLGISYALVGHSERRHYFNESDDVVLEKVNRCLENNIKPIVCVGEPLKIRENKQHIEFVSNQVINNLFHLNADDFENIVIAYEPVWAIGTGKTASPEQAQEIHKVIRNLVADKYGNEVANNTSILYGGSCKPTNAKQLFAMPDIDGGLIGGAALNAESFIAIYDAV